MREQEHEHEREIKQERERHNSERDREQKTQEVIEVGGWTRLAIVIVYNQCETIETYDNMMRKLD